MFCYCKCSVALPHGAMGWSAVCDVVFPDILTYFLVRLHKCADTSFTHMGYIKKITNSTTCIKRPLSKRPKIGFHNQLLLNLGQKYCRVLPLEHSAILSTFIKLVIVTNIFVLSIYEWSFYTGFSVQAKILTLSNSSRIN